jgi:hypothetical protein
VGTDWSDGVSVDSVGAEAGGADKSDGVVTDGIGLEGVRHADAQILVV